MDPLNSVDIERDLLYNIGIGQATSEQVSDFLLNAEKKAIH